ncbi:MAG: zinc-dependent metalloprotease [Lewinella sp.]|nr:zinc-dependent metalloprotease [Lewinella sp.]
MKQHHHAIGFSMASLLSLLLIIPLTAQTTWCAPPAPPLSAAGTTPQGRPKQVITIPVVVHIVWHEEAENINDAQVLSQLDVINEDYRGLNADQADVWVEFQDDIADMELQFELATVGPQGQATNGIHRVFTSSANIGGDPPVDGRRPVCHTDLGGSDAWFPGCYLNIWVCALPPGVAGQGTFPGSVPADEDGVFIAPDRFGTTGSVAPPYQLGRTLTHEIGHWLNLFHLWGPETLPQDPCPASTCCNDPLYDDLVDDTPVQVATYTQACPSPPQQTCGSRDMFQNFMGLSYDPCLLFFTPGQKERAWQTITGLRSGLLDANCITEVRAPDPAPFLLRYFARDGQLWLETTPGGPSQWQLYDLQGRRVGRFELMGGGLQSVFLPSLPTGVYWLCGQNRTTQTTKKIIIVKD